MPLEVLDLVFVVSGCHTAQMYKKSREIGGFRPVEPLSLGAMDALESQIYNEYLRQLPTKCRGEGKKGEFTDFRKVAERYEAVFFDAWGTLYVRDVLFPGALETVQGLRRAGVKVRLVTNSASLSPLSISRKLERLGFDFADGEIFSACAHLRSIAAELGISELFHVGRNESLPGIAEAGLRDTPTPARPVVAITSVPLDEDGSTARIPVAREILSRPGAVALILNPDAGAPLLGGGRCRAAGAFGMELVRGTGAKVVRTGKPFPRLFREALASVGCAPERALMVGDTLGTDVAGGNGAGLDTLLVAQCYGAPEEWRADAELIDVRPDWVAPGIGAGFLP